MNREKKFTREDAKKVGDKLGINWSVFDLDQFTLGMNVELEHGSIHRSTDVTKNDPILTGKIAIAHMFEFPDYYVRLTRMEEEAEAYWGKKDDND